ncbi:hypothetical protein [Roseiconus lacunae]|uniref:DUF4861 domain-containing protein n=1 Tax=Roseiconus lacunae TaxID=2605694 RepID=A0ABT7PRA7_9BACT|nr:hypothetical protein [Roseiconus lacunae]MDM4019049.1 hypothetical protein [Roseiconus lacunae]
MNVRLCCGVTVLAVMVPSISWSQGMILDKAERDARAEQYMVEYIDGTDLKSDSIAMIARCQVWSSDDDRIADNIYGFVRDPKNSFSYSVKGLFSDVMPTGVRLWTQHLERGGKKFARYGGGDRNDVFFDSQERNTGKDPPAFFTNPRFLEPCSLSVSCRPDFLQGRLSKDYPTVTYLKNGRFIGSEMDDEGQIVGVWQCYGERGAVIDIAFAKEEHHFPERVIIRRAKGRHTLENRSECPIFAITKTEWKRLVASDDSARVLPHAISTVALQMGSRIPKYEMVVRLRWAVDVERKHNLPDLVVVKGLFNTRYDWTALLQERIADDWSLHFADAIQQWKEQETSADRTVIHGYAPPSGK